MKTFFVTGVGGQLGHDVVNELTSRGYKVTGSDIAPSYSGIDDGSAVCHADYMSLDITDRAAVHNALTRLHPDAVIHCAAWTAVDAAEDDANQGKVMAVNKDGTENIALACKEIDAVMTYISTDYVFNGKGDKPWDPDCKDYAPLNVYGKSKLAGELAVSSNLSKYFIVRIAWVFGLNGKNFIKTMLSVGKKHDEVRVVNDQIGTPTYTLDLAVLLADMNESEKYGYYHATNSELDASLGEHDANGTKTGFISWYDFTKEIYRQAGLTARVSPVSTEEYGLSKAARPFNSRLDKSKLVKNGFKPLPAWPDAVARFLNTIDISSL